MSVKSCRAPSLLMLRYSMPFGIGTVTPVFWLPSEMTSAALLFDRKTSKVPSPVSV